MALPSRNPWPTPAWRALQVSVEPHIACSLTCGGTPAAPEGILSLVTGVSFIHCLQPLFKLGPFLKHSRLSETWVQNRVYDPAGSGCLRRLGGAPWS